MTLFGWQCRDKYAELNGNIAEILASMVEIVTSCIIGCSKIENTDSLTTELLNDADIGNIILFQKIINIIKLYNQCHLY